MIGLSRAIDRGLYRVGRVWEDWSPFVLLVVLVAAAFGLAGAIWVTVARYTAHDWHIFGVYVLSEILFVLPFGSDKTKKIRDFDGEVLVWTIDAIARHSYILDLRERMLGDALGAALWGGGIGAGLLIGTVLVAHIVHWRKARKRRRRDVETRGTVAPRRPAGQSFRGILRRVQTSVRFVCNGIVLRARVGTAELGDAKPAVGKAHAAEAAAGGLEQKWSILAAPAAFGGPVIRPSAAVRSARQGRPNAAEAPLGEAHLRSGRHSDGEAHLVPRETPPSATSPPAPPISPPAAIDSSSIPSCSEPTSRKLRSPGQDYHDVGTSKAGGSAPTGSDSTQQHEAAARESRSVDAGSTVPLTERVASDVRVPGSNERPLGKRPDARRRRGKASQDFY